MSKGAEKPSQTVSEYILNLLMTKKLMPGEKIGEARLAEEIGCSRTPIRDALKQMESYGLVEIYPNRFVQVADYTPEMISEVGTLRLSMEQLAGRLALMFGNRVDFLRLRQIAEECRRALQEGDYTRRVELDCQFHMELSRIGGHKLLLRYQNEIYLRVKFIILHHPCIIEDETTHLNQHFEIVDALEAGDKERMQEAIQQHITSFYSRYTTIPEEILQ
ncbi:MAG: GntR family transcriptional regulator [Agathobaculum sp.]|jgi:DNA-binding GntR family transcriptional regulator|uniref:GntR family transcriptional regulator n=1 Tax=Agathobaculum sp. TaxID=2048138 RepID=UPI003D89BFF4